MLEAVREMPCDEDFEKWIPMSQGLPAQVVSHPVKTGADRFAGSMHGGQGQQDPFPPRPGGGLAEQAAEKDFCNRFKAALPERDRTILELRGEGIRLSEIADKLGYKTHSAVIKRMEAIKNGSFGTKMRKAVKPRKPENGGRGFSVPKFRKEAVCFG